MGEGDDQVKLETVLQRTKAVEEGLGLVLNPPLADEMARTWLHIKNTLN